jgi:hypothetical protein
MATILSKPRFSHVAMALLLGGFAVAGCQGNLGNDVPPGPGASGTPTPPPTTMTPAPTTPPNVTPPNVTPTPTPPPPGPGPVTPPVPPPVAPPETPPDTTPTPTPTPPMGMPTPTPPPTPPPAPPSVPAPPVGEKRAVYVINDIDNPSIGDEDIIFLMQSQGFAVEVADDNDRSRDFRTAGLIVISSSANAGQLGDEWDTNQPALILSSGMFSEMGMTANGNNNAGNQNARIIEIVDAKHPIASGRSGRITIADANLALNFGAPGPDATIIATVNNDRRRATIFAYDAGDKLVGANRVARNRRVGFFLRENDNDGTEDLRNDGAALFDAAVTWTWNGEGGSGGAATPPAATPPATPTPPPGSGY